MKTDFAPAKRFKKPELREDVEIIKKQQDLKFFLDSMPVYILILNETRQIIFANETFVKFLKAENSDELVGQRTGEAIKCIHSYENEAGCGTSESCRECGAIKAVLESRSQNIKSAREARLSLMNGESLDVLVWATPYIISDKEYTIATISDISAEKRKRALEKIFFHDVLNTAGVLKNYCELIQTCDEKEEQDYLLKITTNVAIELIEEIEAQKNLTSLESGEYEIDVSDFTSEEIIVGVKNSFIHLPIHSEKNIDVSEIANANLVSDKTLIRRILFNLVKNALEAIQRGETIKIGCTTLNDEVAFFVHNPGAIPQNVKLQIFQRSFSTKGSGRGLGTYSVKLLTEKYLKGRVYFESNEKSGTTFYVIFPRTITTF